MQEIGKYKNSFYERIMRDVGIVRDQMFTSIRGYREEKKCQQNQDRRIYTYYMYIISSLKATDYHNRNFHFQYTFFFLCAVSLHLSNLCDTIKIKIYSTISAYIRVKSTHI